MVIREERLQGGCESNDAKEQATASENRAWAAASAFPLRRLEIAEGREQKLKGGLGMNGLSEGVIQFYSSQAELLLAQYEHINHLLGPTSDWTHPGTHCEVLLRDFLRRHLLQGMSVDKGFVFGRVERDGKEGHGPEIDLLIHDTIDYRPVFRLEDFVIVQPEAMLGIIQVKRTFHAGQKGTLAKGIRQAVGAKQHLLDMIVQSKVTEMTAAYRGDSTLVKKFPEYPDMKQVFSAVVSFEDETDKDSETYRQLLLDAYRENRCCVFTECAYDTGVYVLPHFVGSLKHLSLTSDGRQNGYRQYYVFESVHEGRNIGLQLLLASLTATIFDFKKKRPPFAFPKTQKPPEVVQVPRPDESLHKPVLPPPKAEHESTSPTASA
jgi:hypothetical protein